MLASAPENATAQVVASHPLLRRGIISTTRNYRPNIAEFAEKMCRVVQSEDGRLDLSEVLFSLVTFQPVEVRGGGGGSTVRRPLSARTIYSIPEWARQKRCLWDPAKSLQGLPKAAREIIEERCLLAVLVGQLFKLRHKPKAAAFVAYRRSLAMREDMEYWENIINEEGGDGGQSLDDLELLSPLLALEDTGIAVFDDTSRPFKRINSDAAKQVLIFILYAEDGGSTFHAYGITSLQAFFGTPASCSRCMKGHGGRSRHRCPRSHCSLCQFAACTNTNPEREIPAPLRCSENCGLRFWTEACFKAHLAYCANRSMCSVCGVSVHKYSKHTCGIISCSRCNAQHSPLETCYVSKGRSTSLGKSRIFFGDCESMVEKTTGMHSVNLIIVQDAEGEKEYVYTGSSATALFIKDVISQGSPYTDSYIIFHNGGGLGLLFSGSERERASIFQV